MRLAASLVILLSLACASAPVTECELDLSVAGFVDELTHGQATQRTSAFDDYTAGSYHVEMRTLVDAVRRERLRTPGIQKLIAEGPFGPVWQYNIMLILREGEAFRANMIAMPHARIVWKATSRLTSEQVDGLEQALVVATTEGAVSDEATLLSVTWTDASESVRSSSASFYKALPENIERALRVMEAIGDGATVTYSNDLGDDVPLYRCSPAP